MKRASILSLSALAAFAAAALALAPSGCGTGVSNDVFANSGDTGDTTGSPTTASNASAGSGGGSSTTSGGGSNPTTSSASGMGGGTGSAGGSDPSTNASSVASTTASTGGGAIVLQCGDGAKCSLPPDSACCWNNQQKTAACVQGSPDADNCATTPQEGQFETRIECQSAAECGAGAVCCGKREFLQNGTYYSQLTCETQCDWPNIIMCDQAGEMGPDCPVVTTQQQQVQTVCKASQLLPGGYLVCGTP